VTTGLRAPVAAAPDGLGTPADLVAAVMALLHSFRCSTPLDVPLVAAGVAAFGVWGDLKSRVAFLYAASPLPVPSGLSAAAAAAMVSVAATPAAVAAAAAAAAAGVPERAARRTWRGGGGRRRRCACRRRSLGAVGVYGPRGARLPRRKADRRRRGAAQDEVAGRCSQPRERVNAQCHVGGGGGRRRQRQRRRWRRRRRCVRPGRRGSRHGRRRRRRDGGGRRRTPPRVDDANRRHGSPRGRHP